MLTENSLPIFSTTKCYPHGWGEEIWIYNGSEYCGKILKFKKDGSFSFHMHEKKESWLIKGRFIFEYFNGKTGERLKKYLVTDDVVTIPPHVLHKMTASGEGCEIFEVSTEHTENGSFRVEGGDSQK